MAAINTITAFYLHLSLTKQLTNQPSSQPANKPTNETFELNKDNHKTYQCTEGLYCLNITLLLPTGLYETQSLQGVNPT